MFHGKVTPNGIEWDDVSILEKDHHPPDRAENFHLFNDFCSINEDDSRILTNTEIEIEHHEIEGKTDKHPNDA